MDIITDTLINELKTLDTNWLKKWISEEKEVNTNILKMIIFKFHMLLNEKKRDCNKDIIQHIFVISCIHVLFDLSNKEHEWSIFQERWRKRFFLYSKKYSLDDFFYLITKYIDREKAKNNYFTSTA